ncbi:AraC family transcriptional regulator [Mucilaginibacter sp. RB4R14]|uniref:AraC family transcriptional regulator n=1 Tax=Mucilaginibacter aurantiaciroseus TaxID=2949308 RepID=UPI0020911F45|nr:AraC family transcriptional regulator [Mucilaginibacter aurantiaciroseus]MCO5936491.1 AraC family transcriptional regulator [Mucilaginibacter aurantiaciroseus]
MNFKKDGFDGQKAIVIPRSVLNRFCAAGTMINGTYLTDIGYYPKARLHKRTRSQGAEQNILIYCIDGQGEVTVDGIKYNILSGDFFTIPLGKTHTYRASEDNPWTIYWCHFKGEQSDALLKMLYTKTDGYKSNVSFFPDRIEIFNRLYRSLEQGYSLENLTYINLLLLQYLSSFIFSDRMATGVSDNNGEVLEKSIIYMQKNLGKGLSLAELASSVNLSISHYSAVFKKKTGFSPIEYFNHLKIQKACQYLQFTQMRVREIAFMIGIDDPFYFSRLFTKTMGFGPREYRETRYSTSKIPK